jgi:hypothetical protein
MRRLRALVAVILFGGCQSPGERAMASLEQGLDELVILIERRDRGEIDDDAMAAALERWHGGSGRELEASAREAARSTGPRSRADLEARWRTTSRALAKRLGDTSKHKLDMSE